MKEYTLYATMGAGIGMFLVVLGLEKAGIVKSGGSRSLLAMGIMSDV